MKTTYEKRDVTSNLGDFESNEFSIAVNHKSFRVLLDTLYTNKVKAIIRELWTNAYDSHIEAGQDKPFECELPTMLAPTFSVRDFGVGMDHHQIMKLYTTVFHSSKEETNEQVGMLGLGSKSPFCYVDSFTVEAFDGSHVRNYIAAINNEGIPTITHVSNQPSNEPRGIKVSLPVKMKDFKEFQTEASFVAEGFISPPTVNGELLYKRQEPVFAGDGWAVYNRGANTRSNNDPYGTTRNRSSQFFIQQGCVVYPVDSSVPIKNSGQLGYNHELVVNVPIGTVEVAANREALSLNDQTKQNIVTVIDQTFAKIHKFVEDKIGVAPNILEAEKLNLEYKNLFHYNSVRKFMYKGQLLTGEIDLTSLKLNMVDYRWQPVRQNYNGKFQVTNLKDYQFVIEKSDEKVLRKRKRVSTYGRSNYRKMISLFVLLDPTDYQIKTLKAKLGLTKDQVITISEVPDVAPVVSSGPNAQTGVKKTGTYSLDYKRLKREDYPKSDFYWVPIEKGTDDRIQIPSMGSMSVSDMGRIFDFATSNDLVAAKPMYFLTPAAQKKAADSNKFSEVLDNAIKTKQVSILKNIENQNIYNSLWRDKSYQLLEEDQLNAILGTKHKSNSGWDGHIQRLVTKILGDEYEKTIKKCDIEAAKVKEKYPMLFRPTQAQITQYINERNKI